MRIWPNREMGDNENRKKGTELRGILRITGKYLSLVTIGKDRGESQRMMKTASHWLGFTLLMDSSILPSHIFIEHLPWA